MAFHYYVLLSPGRLERARGLMAFEPERFHTIAYNHLTRRFEHAPDLVIGHVMGGDRSGRLQEVSRQEAERVSAELGVPLPSEAELAQIGEEAARRGR